MGLAALAMISERARGPHQEGFLANWRNSHDVICRFHVTSMLVSCHADQRGRQEWG